MYIPSKDLLSTFSVYWSSDNTIILETPAVRVTLSNDKEARVEDKNLLADGSRCGLCGDYNRHLIAEIKSPKGCVFSSPYAAALSYSKHLALLQLSFSFLLPQQHRLFNQVQEHLDRVLTIIIARHWECDQIWIAVSVY